MKIIIKKKNQIAIKSPINNLPGGKEIYIELGSTEPFRKKGVFSL